MDAHEPAGGAPSPEQDEAPEGVFGNLPRTRPGARSPRRDREEARRSRPRAAASGNQPHERPTAETGGQAPEEESVSGLEDVAWAGVAAAAEAATIGVRLANRALEAMRDAVDRR
jgi:hypothetical protein